jgi:hypothetical protein
MPFIDPDFWRHKPDDYVPTVSWKEKPVSYEESDVRKNALLMYGYLLPLMVAIWNAYAAGSMAMSWLLVCASIGWNELS